MTLFLLKIGINKTAKNFFFFVFQFRGVLPTFPKKRWRVFLGAFFFAEMHHNFFVALSASLSPDSDPSDLHKRIILHFCSIMFQNGHLYKSIAHVLENKTILQLEPACIHHPAVKLWIKKIHKAEPHLHSDPKDWFIAYPKLLKALALRFIHYHRSYRDKPLRLFSANMFAQLACEVFCCHICLDGTWFCPLETADYFLKLDLPVIVMQRDLQHPGCFYLESAKDVEPLLVPQLELIKE